MATTRVADLVQNVKTNIYNYLDTCNFLSEEDKQFIQNDPKEIEQIVRKYPNPVSRLLSEIMLGYFGDHLSVTAQWLQLGNYFFAVLPGIISLYLFIQKYSMSDAELVSQQQRIRAFRGITTSFVLIGVMTPLVITIFQMIVFDRLVFIKIAPPVLIGQTVSVIMWFLTWSGSVIRWFNNDLRMYHVLPLFFIVCGWTFALAFDKQPLHPVIALIIIGVGVLLTILSAIPSFRWHKYFRIGLFMACLAIMVFLIHIRHFILSGSDDRTVCRQQLTEWKDHFENVLGLAPKGARQAHIATTKTPNLSPFLLML